MDIALALGDGLPDDVRLVQKSRDCFVISGSQRSSIKRAALIWKTERHGLGPAPAPPEGLEGLARGDDAQRQMPARPKTRRYGSMAAVCFVREIATSGSGGTTMGNSAG